MARLELSVAVGDYDRTRSLIDGATPIDGVAPIFLALQPEEIFFRAFRHAEFDIAELSLSSFAIRTAAGDNPYVGVPVFLSRAFRHNAIYIRTDRGIAAPADLGGRRIGIPEYQMTACVWARALLEEEFGVKPSDISWVRGGLEEPGRVEKIALQLPADVAIEPAPEGATLSGLLATGGIDGIIAPRAPSCFRRDPGVGRLFPDPGAAASDYFRRTGVFPIMHLLGVRRALVDRHSWLPASLLKAFAQAKAIAVARLAELAASRITLPFVEDSVSAARALMGEDYWPYGVAPNRAVLDAFLRHHHAQNLSRRLLALEELFHPATFETPRI